MRTSRISRDTARIVNALSPEKRRATRRSLRAFAATTMTDEAEDGAESSGSSRMSTPPSSPGEDDYDSSSQSNLGKRKRGNARASSSSTSLSNRRTSRNIAKSDPDAASPKSKIKRQPAKRIKGEPKAPISRSPPANWERMYEITANMRKNIVAPVDTMGCETLALKDIPAVDQRLQTLVALMLSSQTKDTVTAAAMKRLQTELPGGLTLTSLLDVEPTELNNLIGSVGFHNNKTKYLKATALILRDSFAGDIPSTIDGMTSLPGVGPKMAYLCMSAAWGRDEGIGVDVHVHRITNRWGWHNTTTPEQTRENLEAWLPKDKWHQINTLLVGLGQVVCLPIGRRCGDCDLQETGLCPSALSGSPTKRKVKVEVKEEVHSELVDEQSGNVKIEHTETTVKVEPGLEYEAPVVPDVEGVGEGVLRRSLSP